jgi:hypothetical protein
MQNAYGRRGLLIRKPEIMAPKNSKQLPGILFSEFERFSVVFENDGGDQISEQTLQGDMASG